VSVKYVIADMVQEETTFEGLLWRAIHVRKGFERIVAHNFENRGFETFLPFRSIHHRPPDGKVRSDVPLFPGHVLCKCTVAACRSVFFIPGVLAVVRVPGPAGVVHAQEVESIRRVVNSGFPYEMWQYTNGRVVRVEDGPFQGLTGVLSNTDERHRLVFSISSIRQSVAIEIDESWHISQLFCASNR